MCHPHTHEQVREPCLQVPVLLRGVGGQVDDAQPQRLQHVEGAVAHRRADARERRHRRRRSRALQQVSGATQVLLRYGESVT